MNTTVTRALAATTVMNLAGCALFAGPNAGIAWWITAYVCMYPIMHLAVKHTTR